MALKVFRTPIGFHDAYVAAPSRKAALAAWGADNDLFASGSAELVTDPALTAESLASPGEVIKRSRGSVADHLDAAARAKPQGKLRGKPQGEPKPAKGQGAAPPSKAARAPKPRPARDELDQAEAAIGAFETQAAIERGKLDRREAELLEERKALNARQRREAEKLEVQRDAARDSFDRAMERWRSET
jgi:hypothetical protein